MKITLTDDVKNILSMNDADAVKSIQQQFKKESFSWEAESAISLAAGRKCILPKVISISAEIMKNRRVWDYYGTETHDIDIWLTATAYDIIGGFYIVSFYLSDIWQLCSDDESREATRRHMYIRHFTEAKE